MFIITFHISFEDLILLLSIAFRCDPGFAGEFCVPSKPLPMTLREDFEQGVEKNHWREVYGADASDVLCDTVVSGKALTFYKVYSPPIIRNSSRFQQIQKASSVFNAHVHFRIVF